MSERMTKIQKIAITMLYLESKQPDTATKIINALGPSIARQVIQEMKQLTMVDKETIVKTVNEINAMFSTDSLVGGKNISRVLSQDIEDVSDQSVKELESYSLFSFLSDFQTNEINYVLKDEPMELLILLASYMSKKKLSQFLEESDELTALEIVKSNMLHKNVNLKLLQQFEKFLEKLFYEKKDQKAILSSDGDNKQQLKKLAFSLELVKDSKKDTILSKFSKTHKDFSKKLKDEMLSISWFLKQPAEFKEKVFDKIEEVETIYGVFSHLKESDEKLILDVLLPRSKQIYLDLKNQRGLISDIEIQENKKNFIIFLRTLMDSEDLVIKEKPLDLKEK